MDDAGTYIVIAMIAGVIAAGSLMRAWALLAVVVLCVVGFVASGAEALAWLWLMLCLPALAVAALGGWALRALPIRRSWLLPAGAAAVALLIAAVLTGRRAALDPVPAKVAAELPRDTGALGALCFDELPAEERRSARRQVRALVRELPRRPDGLTTVRYTLAETDGYRDAQKTLRELAEELLESSCASPETDALRRALATAD
jgi:hypothetical protein